MGKYRCASIVPLLLLLLYLSGCAKEDIVFLEVKRPHEVLKAAEVNQYLQILQELPEQKLPELPPLFAQLPQWDLQRELSIKSLVKEEQKASQERWFSESVLTRLGQQRHLQKILKKHGLSLKQFLGLAETLSVAAARTKITSELELKNILRNGQHEVNELLKREEVFANLPQTERYEILHRAEWITRTDRAAVLSRVPAENIALLKKHWQTLAPHLHPDASQHPLNEIVDRVKHFGIPFEELSQTGSDAHLHWSHNDDRALIGQARKEAAPSAPAPNAALPGNPPAR